MDRSAFSKHRQVSITVPISAVVRLEEPRTRAEVIEALIKILRALIELRREVQKLLRRLLGR